MYLVPRRSSCIVPRTGPRPWDPRELAQAARLVPILVSAIGLVLLSTMKNDWGNDCKELFGVRRLTRLAIGSSPPSPLVFASWLRARGQARALRGVTDNRGPNGYC